MAKRGPIHQAQVQGQNVKIQLRIFLSTQQWMIWENVLIIPIEQIVNQVHLFRSWDLIIPYKYLNKNNIACALTSRSSWRNQPSTILHARNNQLLSDMTYLARTGFRRCGTSWPQLSSGPLGRKNNHLWKQPFSFWPVFLWAVQVHHPFIAGLMQ